MYAIRSYYGAEQGLRLVPRLFRVAACLVARDPLDHHAAGHPERRIARPFELGERQADAGRHLFGLGEVVLRTFRQRAFSYNFV